jgi:hypothetical protein
MELRQLGIEVDEQRLIQAKRTEESKAQQRTRIREQVEKLSEEALLVESGENVVYCLVNP